MHYIRFTKHDVDDVIKFLVNDPHALDSVQRNLSLSRDDALTFIKGLFNEAISSGVSYLAKTDAHEVVALRLSTFRTRDEAAEEAQGLPYEDLSTTLSRTLAMLRTLHQQFWAAVDPDINKVYFLMAVLVSDKYCGTDLADNLIHHNMDEIRFMKVDGLAADAAIFHSQKKIEDFGYRVVAEVDRSTFLSAEDVSHDHESDKAGIVFKEPWRDETIGAHIGC
ncbi:hypothetical protein V3C99_006096 [Haemonchus contortus]|uniref:N-acetyltransferase domain-containing protein n=1 Tax=Haemonchus contortus TaxID=6289 RepID=A0A7I4XU45_HAECO|nr:acetyltransferase [Haemonchus contortus]